MKILVIGGTDLNRSRLMRFDGHYDAHADIAWLRFEGYNPATAVAERAGYGYRELDIAHREVVGLQYWQASRNLPADLLAMLPRPAPSLADDSPDADQRLSLHRAEGLR